MNIEEKIENYIEGLMTTDEILEFEELLKKDIDLTIEVKQKKKLHDMLRKKLKYKSPSMQGFPENKLSKTQELSIDDDLDNFLYNYEGGISNEEKKLIQFLKNKNKETSSRGIGFYLSIAATITLLLIISTGVKKLVNQKINYNLSQNIFYEYYQPSADSNLQDIIPENLMFKDNILITKTTGEKAGTKMNLESLRSEKKTDEDLLNLSILCLQNDKFSMATLNLELLLKSQDEKISLMSRWYYSLTQIKLNNFEIAKEYLIKIENSDSAYAAKAAEILKKLNK
jgi:hypothetical protein